MLYWLRNNSKILLKQTQQLVHLLIELNIGFWDHCDGFCMVYFCERTAVCGNDRSHYVTSTCNPTTCMQLSHM